MGHVKQHYRLICDIYLHIVMYNDRIYPQDLVGSCEKYYRQALNPYMCEKTRLFMTILWDKSALGRKYQDNPLKTIT